MKKTAKNELRAKGADELVQQVTELRNGQLRTRLTAGTEGKAKGMGYRAARRQIARLQTLITEKQKAAAQ
jgi:ribosomal protein L29